MGIFSFLFGGKKSESKLPGSAIDALNLLFRSVAQSFPQKIDRGVEGVQPLQGLPLVTGFPDFTTVFNKLQNGQLTPLEEGIFGQIDSLISPEQADKRFESIAEGIGLGSGQIGSFGGKVTFQDIGTITSNILQNMPPQIRKFVTQTFKSTSPEMINQELDNLSNSLLADAERSATSLGGQLLGTFAAQGLGTSGTAVDALKEFGADLAVRTNAQIAQARLSALESLMNERRIGVELVNVLGNLGANEQANQVRARVAELDAQVTLQAQALQNQTALQAALIDSRTRLEMLRQGNITNLLGLITQERGAEEAQKLQKFKFPFEILTGIGTGTPVESQFKEEPGLIPSLLKNISLVFQKPL